MCMKGSTGLRLAYKRFRKVVPLVLYLSEAFGGKYEPAELCKGSMFNSNARRWGETVTTTTATTTTYDTKKASTMGE